MVLLVAAVVAVVAVDPAVCWCSEGVELVVVVVVVVVVVWV